MTRLWARDPAAQSPDYPAMLQKLADHATARKLACKRPLDHPLESLDRKRAKAFALRIDDDNAENGKNWQPKQRCIRQLPNEAFAIAAVHLPATELLNHKVNTVKALSDGFQRVAKWSDWPKDPELKQLIEMRTRSAVVANPALRADTSPSNAPTPCLAPTSTIVPTVIDAPDTTCAAQQSQPIPWVLTCRSCRTELSLQCACKHATGKFPWFLFPLPS